MAEKESGYSYAAESGLQDGSVESFKVGYRAGKDGGLIVGTVVRRRYAEVPQGGKEVVAQVLLLLHEQR